MEKIVHKGADSKPIGFNADIEKSNEKVFNLNDVQQHDLVKYGLMPELIGRLPVVTTLNPLSEADLIKILTEPKNALTKQYQELLAMDGVRLEFEDDALKRVAHKATERHTGARGLRSILENSMRDLMFEMPDQSDIEKVIITGDYIDRKADALIYRNKDRKSA